MNRFFPFTHIASLQADKVISQGLLLAAAILMITRASGLEEIKSNHISNVNNNNNNNAVQDREDIHLMQTDLLLRMLHDKNKSETDGGDDYEYYYVYEYVDDNGLPIDEDLDFQTDDDEDMEVAESMPVPEALVGGQTNENQLVPVENRASTLLGLQNLEFGSYSECTTRTFILILLYISICT